MKSKDKFSTRSALALAAILEDLQIIDRGKRICISRVYAGRHQRSAGAWSWSAEDEEGHEICGSQWPVKDIVCAHYDRDKYISVYTSPWGAVSLSPETKREQVNTADVRSL